MEVPSDGPCRGRALQAWYSGEHWACKSHTRLTELSKLMQQRAHVDRDAGSDAAHTTAESKRLAAVEKRRSQADFVAQSLKRLRLDDPGDAVEDAAMKL